MGRRGRAGSKPWPAQDSPGVNVVRISDTEQTVPRGTRRGVVVFKTAARETGAAGESPARLDDQLESLVIGSIDFRGDFY